MNIKLVDRGTKAEVILSGRLDVRTADDAETILMQIADKYDTIELNFIDLTYISSAGLRILQKLNGKLRKKGGVLEASNIPPSIANIFEMVGLSDMFVQR